MKIKKVICVLILFISPGLVSAESSFSKMYVFGDSLSDTGNLAALKIAELPPELPILPSPVPYYNFRVSNGPVAVDVLADLLGTDARAFLDYTLGVNLPGTNYAVAGARAGGVRETDLVGQVTHFLGFHTPPGTPYPIAPSDALYVIMIGGNDVRDARDDEVLAEGIIETAVGTIIQAVETLKQYGAQTFYVVNSPNIGLIPETLVFGDKKYAKDTTKLSKKFNKKLNKELSRFEKEHDMDIMLFDLFDFGNTIHKNSLSLGLLNNSDACYVGLDVVALYLYGEYPDGEYCNNELGGVVSEYAFFDEIHPTAFVHERIGQAMFSLVPVSD